MAPVPSAGGQASRAALGGAEGPAPFERRPSDNSDKMVSLLEEIAHGREHEKMRESDLPSLGGPVREKGWQTLFNEQPLEMDGNGNAILRRR